MTRRAYIVLLVGLLVGGIALLTLRIGDRPNAENPAASPGSQRAGRSTLSHGGPGVGILPDNAPRLPAGGRNESSK